MQEENQVLKKKYLKICFTLYACFYYVEENEQKIIYTNIHISTQYLSPIDSEIS